VLVEHLDECSHRPEQCPNGCGTEIPHCEMQEHRLFCLLEEVQCPLADSACACGGHVYRVDLEDHLFNPKSFLTMVLENSQMKKEISELKEEIATLKRFNKTVRFEGYADWVNSNNLSDSDHWSLVDRACCAKYTRSRAATWTELSENLIQGLPEINDSGNTVLFRLHEGNPGGSQIFTKGIKPNVAFGDKTKYLTYFGNLNRCSVVCVVEKIAF